MKAALQWSVGGGFMAKTCFYAIGNLSFVIKYITKISSEIFSFLPRMY